MILRTHSLPHRNENKKEKEKNSLRPSVGLMTHVDLAHMWPRELRPPHLQRRFCQFCLCFLVRISSFDFFLTFISLQLAARPRFLPRFSPRSHPRSRPPYRPILKRARTRERERESSNEGSHASDTLLTFGLHAQSWSKLSHETRGRVRTGNAVAQHWCLARRMSRF